MKRYPLAKPYIRNEEIRAVTQVLKSGSLSLGPVHVQFEKEFAKKIGTKYASCVSSGTAGLHLALLAAGIKPGDEVITSPFSFIASSNSLLYIGAKPVFVDIDPLTYNLDPAKIEAKITKKTTAILVVHVFGQAAEMDSIMKIAGKHGLKIIEDACESILATYKGRKVGTFGESAVFSFYPNKQMTTGEGGILVTNNHKTDKLTKSLRNQGRTDNMKWLDHNVLGYNYRLNELSAALGLAQLKKINWLIGQRAKIASWYHKYLGKHPHLLQLPYTARLNVHTWFLYVVKLKNPKINRNKLIKTLGREGISTKAYFPSIHLFEFYRKRFRYRPGMFPISEAVSRYSLALPFYIGLNETDVKYISQLLISKLS